MNPTQRAQFDKLVEQFDRHINVLSSDTFGGRMKLLRREVVAAKAALRNGKATYIDVASAIGQCGGLGRQWRAYLVKSLTEVVFQDHDVSRLYVSGWQKEVFGRSLSSRELKRYAVPEHNGGGRAQRDLLDSEAVEMARDLFFKYSDRLVLIDDGAL